MLICFTWFNQTVCVIVVFFWFVCIVFIDVLCLILISRYISEPTVVEGIQRLLGEHEGELFDSKRQWAGSSCCHVQVSLITAGGVCVTFVPVTEVSVLIHQCHYLLSFRERERETRFTVQSWSYDSDHTLLFYTPLLCHSLSSELYSSD